VPNRSKTEGPRIGRGFSHRRSPIIRRAVLAAVRRTVTIVGIAHREEALSCPRSRVLVPTGVRVRRVGENGALRSPRVRVWVPTGGKNGLTATAGATASSSSRVLVPTGTQGLQKFEPRSRVLVPTETHCPITGVEGENSNAQTEFRWLPVWGIVVQRGPVIADHPIEA
jgi:hypothetical protein